MIVNLKERDRDSMKHLLAHAEAYATAAILTEKQCPPTLFVQNLKGTIKFTPDKFTTEETKDHFVTVAKLICVAHNATATVFVGEGWTRFAKANEPLDTSKKPSECPDRQEILMLMGETRYQTENKLLPILRTTDGHFIGFAKAHHFENARVEGRCAHYLPQEYPSHDQQNAAKAALHDAIKDVRQEQKHELGREAG